MIGIDTISKNPTQLIATIFDTIFCLYLGHKKDTKCQTLTHY
jgi:hypothetical protein